jgi:hypothetical protein
MITQHRREQCRVNTATWRAAHPERGAIDVANNFAWLSANPVKGLYIKGNVIIVSLRANLLKGQATIEELRKIADFYGRLP